MVISRNSSQYIDSKENTKDKLTNILEELQNYLKERSLSDQNWIKAISSQYFLIETAHILQLTDTNSYQELEAEFFDTSCRFRKGVVQPSPQKILVVPDENEKLINRMQQEDDAGIHYADRLRANRINTKEKKDRIFYNYYYGLMVGIINRFFNKTKDENDGDALNNYRQIRKMAISELFDNNALDEAGGWIHFRLPWITARILISLSSYSDDTIQELIESGAFERVKIKDSDAYKKFIKEAIRSLINRLHQKSIWESGAGNWVTCWEATGLCLEALYSFNCISHYPREIRKIVNYLFLDENVEKWMINPCFDSEEDSNQTLASVILSSVIYRLMNDNLIEENQQIKEQIENLFLKISLGIQKINEEKVQQYCTLPQIIYYIVVALT